MYSLWLGRSYQFTAYTIVSQPFLCRDHRKIIKIKKKLPPIDQNPNPGSIFVLCVSLHILVLRAGLVKIGICPCSPIHINKLYQICANYSHESIEFSSNGLGRETILLVYRPYRLRYLVLFAFRCIPVFLDKYTRLFSNLMYSI